MPRRAPAAGRLSSRPSFEPRPRGFEGAISNAEGRRLLMKAAIFGDEDVDPVGMELAYEEGVVPVVFGLVGSSDILNRGRSQGNGLQYVIQPAASFQTYCRTRASWCLPISSRVAG